MLPSLRRLTASALAAAVAAGLAIAPLTAQASPAEPVEAVDAALLEAMKRADELGFEGRFALLEPVVQESFDLPYMAEIAVGRHWQKLDAEQKRALVEVFGELSVASFAARFDGYSGETFELGQTRDGPRGSKLVVNRLVKGDGEAIPINFLLREVEGEWRIVDILLDAKFSELATKRSEYTSVVGSQGFDQLLVLLERKVAELRTAD
ncbi:MAG: ABC transporter substrate-binding protein [Tistlia sp.]|uniref:ABC transporter substrate-binding protein n=1 Tax=Tistlia sp. TaxID=3057121 RepID=UPI0034A395F1